ncbi:MAG: VIT1/CCC1 transporter family protein [Caldivirga sp.]|jgi:VIT1/CCC1 family predicted Fe2+/Mn2+ transporter|uniref:VIT1/CCC1 transporter family protein n=2 Tax=Caldivirga sp. TaxID=2080243 RepID=UPI003D12CAEE
MNQHGEVLGNVNYIEFYRDELTDYYVYSALARVERNQDRKRALEEIASTELRHAKYWELKAKEAGQSVGEFKAPLLKIMFYLTLRILFGLAVVIRLREREEDEAIIRYVNARDFVKDSTLDEIIRDEVVHEDYFIEEATKMSERFSNIRDFIYGMSDGLVEVMAALAGLVPVVTSPLLIAMAGLIVGVAGTISMSIGAYMSVKAQSELMNYRVSKVRTALRILPISTVSDKVLGILKSSGVPEEKARSIAKELSEYKDAVSDMVITRELGYVESTEDATKSAISTGVSYMIGAALVILPFPTIGLISKYAALSASIILMIIATSIAGLFTAVSSNTKIRNAIARNVGLSLLALMITYLVGSLAHALGATVT